tara:strand:- start:7 stop:492 length:486 start_codon:yes stop_codon:yes gene_type:complete
MLSHKLLLDDVEDNYHLLAIHSSLEEFKLAFLLNMNLQLSLKRTRFDVDFNHGEVQALYPLYFFREPTKYRTYYLFKNKYKGTVKKIVSSGSLFVEEENSTQLTYLIPEYNKVDYFLKIEDDLGEKHIQELLNSISRIPRVITTYIVDVNQLKSRNNLIVD